MRDPGVVRYFLVQVEPQLRRLLLHELREAVNLARLLDDNRGGTVVVTIPILCLPARASVGEVRDIVDGYSCRIIASILKPPQASYERVDYIMLRANDPMIDIREDPTPVTTICVQEHQRQTE